MFNNLRKFLRGGVSHNKQSLNSCFCSLITAFVLVSGVVNIARADVCFLPAGQGCAQVPYEEYDSTTPTYPTDCYATKSEAMSARTDSMDSYYKTGDMWCIKSSCSGYNVTSMMPGGWDCQNCNDAKSKNYNKYKCSCNLEDVTPRSGYTIDLERCEEKPSACPSYASTDCVPDECHECNSISSVNPVYSGEKECLIYSTVDEHCPEGYVPNEPAGGCYATQDMLCGEGKCYQVTETPECSEGKRLVKANGVCSCVSECNANEYASEDVCKQNADECLQNDENNCWFARKFVQIYYSNDLFRDPKTGIKDPGTNDIYTENEQLYVDGNPCADNRCKAYIGQTISISHELIEPINYLSSPTYLLGKGIYEDIWDGLYENGGSDVVKLINDSIVMNDDTIDTYELRDFVRTKSVDWAYEYEDKWLGIVKFDGVANPAVVHLSWHVDPVSNYMFGNEPEFIPYGHLRYDDNKPEFTEFKLYLDKIVDEDNLIKNGLKIPYDIKILITYAPTYRLLANTLFPTCSDMWGGLDCYPLCSDPYFKEFRIQNEVNYFPILIEHCCYDSATHDYNSSIFQVCSEYAYSVKNYKKYVVEKMNTFYEGYDKWKWITAYDEGNDISPIIYDDDNDRWIPSPDLRFYYSSGFDVNASYFDRITVGITIPKDTIELKQETIESYKGSKVPRFLWSADFIPDFDFNNIMSVQYEIDGDLYDSESPEFDERSKVDPYVVPYGINIKKQ